VRVAGLAATLGATFTGALAAGLAAALTTGFATVLATGFAAAARVAGFAAVFGADEAAGLFSVVMFLFCLSLPEIILLFT
jgi:hypothetical protein